MTRALWLPDIARDAGLTVRTHPGWEKQGRPDLDPRGIVEHHTGSSRPADRFLTAGRSDLRGPLCNWSVHPDGSVTIIASGTANHAGTFWVNNPLRAFGANQNAHVYGNEAVHRGLTGIPWPTAQLEAMQAMSAAVCRHHGWSAGRVCGHKEWAGPRKPDPVDLNMDIYRARITALLRTPPTVVPDEEIIMATGLTITVPEFIEALFTLHLGRAPDAKGLAYYTAELVTGRKTPEQIESDIKNSDEARERR